MKFYSDKNRMLPRFFYRNIIEKIDSGARDRGALISELLGVIKNIPSKGDWLKLKWCLPRAVAEKLDPADVDLLEKVLDERRSKRNKKFLEVFPHCSDEFSLRADFLGAAFGAVRVPLIDSGTKIITIGSCFARNIAVFLKSNGFQVKAFQQAEDLNSPFSNAKMLSIAAAPAVVRERYFYFWLSKLYPQISLSQRDSVMEKEIGRLDSLVDFIREASVVVVTCGNVFDYFYQGPRVEGESGPEVAPKFFAMASDEDLDSRSALGRQLRGSGSVFRMGTFGESVDALEWQYQAIRAINPTAKIIITLSPVPIDSAIGVVNPLNYGAIELDCISKSILRAALGQFMASKVADHGIYYFPSFEIVRWVAPNLSMPVFGNEDASSRHVSDVVLNGVYAFFLSRFCLGGLGVAPGN
jgi:GSCFA family